MAVGVQVEQALVASAAVGADASRRQSYRVLVSAGSAEELHLYLREHGSLDRASAADRKIPCQNPAAPVKSFSRL